jgi:hypothetical protein
MENKNEKLWQLATQRAKFKGHVLTYVLVNIFLWIIWFITSNNEIKEAEFIMPWPAWASIGWGFSLVLKYFRLYHGNTEEQIQKEYDKLSNTK